MTTDSHPIVAVAHHVGKRFGGVPALQDVSITVRAGACHAVVGENGAGKSTLMRILSGELTPDGGRVSLADGSPVEPRGREVALVHQELRLVPDLSVAENVCVADVPRKGRLLVSGPAMRARARALLDGLDVDVDVDVPVGRLPLATRQMVEIAKALHQEPRLLILDEPTAALTVTETDRLLTTLANLAREGMAVVFVSHRLPEIFQLCDEATVLRDGRLVGHVRVGDIAPSDLVRMMVGRELQEDLATRRDGRAGRSVLSVRGLRGRGFVEASFDVHAGEIVGFGGLVGAGRSEIVRAALGLDPREGGTVVLHGPDGTAARLRSYRQALREGVAFVPEERRREGVILEHEVGENLVLPSLARVSRGGIQVRRRARSLVNEAMATVDVRPPDPRKAVGLLSGGNQQKVAFGKWLPRRPRLVVLDEPTRGVDVGAKAEIHQLVRRMAAEGAAVLMVSSDLPELLALSDRIVVIRDGLVAGELPGADATEHLVMELATGQSTEEQVGG